MDWKRDIDKGLEATRRKSAEEAWKKDQEHKALEKVTRDPSEYEIKLQEHQSRFKCAYPGCTKVSAGPTITSYTTGNMIHIAGSAMSGNSKIPERKSSANWDKPKNLSLCSNCNQWFCFSHFHEGKCRLCWHK